MNLQAKSIARLAAIAVLSSRLHAGLVYTLNPTSYTSTPGGSITTTGTITNTGPETLAFKSYTCCLWPGGSPNPAGYTGLIPGTTLSPGQSITLSTWTITLRATSPVGSYSGQQLLSYVDQSNSSTVFMASANFTLTVAPGSCNRVVTDLTQSNSQLTVSYGGSCDGVLTIANHKNYWTNFQITTTGSATFTPAGGDANLYAGAGLLPPSGLVGSSTAVAYNVHFSKPGEIVSVYVDPTGQTGMGQAQDLNVIQVFLNATGNAGIATSLISSYQQIIQAFANMPHLSRATSALFSSSPDLFTSVKEMGLFVISIDELSTYLRLLDSLGITAGLTAVKSLFGAPWRVFNTLVSAFGNIIDFSFRYPTGSVLMTAQ